MSKFWAAIGKAYYFFWHDVCKRPEPFTDTMRKSARAHPLTWFLIPAALGAGFYALILHLWGLF